MFTIPKGSEITPDIIKAAIDYNDTNAKRGQKFQKMHCYFEGDHEILRREKKDGVRLKNNKVVTNHAHYITKINTGYLLGNPIDYRMRPTKPGQEADQSPLDAVIEQYHKQGITNIDNEIGTLASIHGVAGEYVYAVDNDVHSRAIDPRHYVAIYDDSMEHAMMAAVLYSCEVKGEKKIYPQTMVVDPKQVTFYKDDLVAVDHIEQHSFGVVPFIEYQNNAELKGDFELVISLIDAYNLLMSDRVNDKEQLVEAILVMYGFTLTPEQIENLRKYGMMSVADADGRAEYINKIMQEESIDVLRKAIEDDIHKISMTPNFSDEKFAGNDSGVAIKYKLISFEINTSTKESYFKNGLLKRIVAYNNYLSKLSKGSSFPAHQVEVIFKRKLPQNDFEASQMISNLQGVVSDKTLVSQLSFVDNAEAEVEASRNDAMQRAERLAQEFGTNNPTGDTNPPPN